jgi:mono/diheme cytochrome c family protein
MDRKRERGGWAMCFGVLGALTVAGAVMVSTPQSAEAQQAPAAANGRPQYNRACGRCHPNGGEDTGPDIHNKNKSVEEMTKIIRSGTGKMRAIGANKLSDADLSKVMNYLRTIHAVR